MGNAPPHMQQAIMQQLAMQQQQAAGGANWQAGILPLSALPSQNQQEVFQAFVSTLTPEQRVALPHIPQQDVSRAVEQFYINMVRQRQQQAAMAEQQEQQQRQLLTIIATLPPALQQAVLQLPEQQRLPAVQHMLALQQQQQQQQQLMAMRQQQAPGLLPANFGGLPPGHPSDFLK